MGCSDGRMEVMRVHHVDLVRVPVSLREPLHTSQGSHTDRVATLVKITTSDGVVGWGENVAPEGVLYVDETSIQSIASMRQLCEQLQQRDIDVEEMFADSWWSDTGKYFAKHAFESALWDAHARSLGVSVSSLLGGTRSEVIPGVVIGMKVSPDDVARTALRHVAEGYTRVKVKVSPGVDLQILKAVREAIGNTIVLQADANGSYSMDDIETLAQFAQFSVQFIEQPFAANDLAGHAELARRIDTPVCLDESVITFANLRDAIDMGACSVVNIKPSRVGGLTDAVRMVNYCEQHGIDAWVGGMLETGIGRASCLALASLPGFTLTPDLSASNRYFERDITEPFGLNHGAIAVPTGPGIGVEPSDWVFAAQSVTKESLF